MQDGRETPQEPTTDPDSGAGDVASVVSVDKREDVATICGRLDSAPTFAVVIHAPRGNQQLATEYGMRRLRRYADETGHVIAIATGNRSLISRATGAGLPVARKPANVRWDRPGRSVVTLGRISLALPSLGPLPGILAIGVGFLIIVLAALFVAPSSTVTVILAGEDVSTDTEITIVAATSSADPENGILVARSVTLTETLLVAVKTTGAAEIATGPSKAVVSIAAPEGGIDIPGGAVLLAGTIRFRLDSDISLESEESTSTTATAVISGPSGNVAAGAIDSWEDEAYHGAIVRNPNAAGEGTATSTSVITEADMTLALDQASALAASKVILDRLAAARTGELIIGESVSAEATPRESALDIGDPADVLVLEVDVVISGDAVSAPALVSLAEAIYETGSQVVLPGTVEVRQLEPSFVGINGTFARVAVTATLVSAIEHGAVRDATKGRRPDDAKQNLLTQYRIDDVEIRLSPGWAPFVPRFGGRINVETRAASGEEVEAPSGP